MCWDIVEMIFGWLVTNTNDNLVIDFGPETLSIYTPYRAMAADNENKKRYSTYVFAPTYFFFSACVIFCRENFYLFLFFEALCKVL